MHSAVDLAILGRCQLQDSLGRCMGPLGGTEGAVGTVDEPPATVAEADDLPF